MWAREKRGKASGSRALGGLAEALRGVRAPCLVHLLDTSRGVAETDPAVRTVTTWPRPPCLGLSRRRRVDMLCLRFGTQRRQPRRRQVCARRDALSSWREVRRPLPHRPGPSRSSTPDAFAPQARLDPPRGWRAGLAWAPALGSHCGLRGRLRHRRAARSEPIVHCRWFHAPRLPVPLARAASSASRVPSACARGAPPGLARPRPRRARVPTPAPRPRQIGSRGRPSNAEPLITGLPADWFPLTGRRMGLEANGVRSV